MKADIRERMCCEHGSDVSLAAHYLNSAETNRIVNVYQTAWDDGESFASTFGGFTALKREADTDEEIGACAQQLYTALKRLVEREWISRLTRDEAKALGNALLCAHIIYPATITICNDMSYDASEIVRLWNELHSGERPICFPDPDIG